MARAMDMPIASSGVKLDAASDLAVQTWWRGARVAAVLIAGGAAAGLIVHVHTAANVAT